MMYYVKELVKSSGPFLRSGVPTDIKIRRGAVGGRDFSKGEHGLRAEGARRLYLGHPGRHSPRSIAMSARAICLLARSPPVT